LIRKEDGMKALRLLLVAVFFLAAVLVFLVSLTSPSQAAQSPDVTATTAPTPNPDALITSPVLVSELNSTVNVEGTADLSNLSSYFLEERPLNPDASVPGDNVAWVPITTPQSMPVQNNVLAAWDTTKVQDGLYELRLTVATTDGQQVQDVVTPLRINNQALQTTTPTQGAGGSAGTGATPDLTPRVIASVNANIRTGDSTLYAAIGVLLRGRSAPVLGISSTGSGWFYVQLTDGTKGWISPLVVAKTGDFSNVPSVTPPPLPPPVATFTPMPPTPGNMQLTGIALDTSTPICGQTFNVNVNVANLTSTFTGSTFLTVQDIHVASGIVNASVAAFVPALSPGQNYVVVVPLVVTSYYNELHQVTANLNGSVVSTYYSLAQGTCNNPPTATPVPIIIVTATPIPVTVVTATPTNTSIAPTGTSIVPPTLTQTPEATQTSTSTPPALTNTPIPTQTSVPTQTTAPTLPPPTRTPVPTQTTAPTLPPPTHTPVPTQTVPPTPPPTQAPARPSPTSVEITIGAPTAFPTPTRTPTAHR
jgi:hypothetical protein